jgi:hypothetical protein
VGSVVTGFLLLSWINHKERRADGEEDEGMTQVEQESPIEPESTTTDTEEPLPREFLTREPEETYLTFREDYLDESSKDAILISQILLGITDSQVLFVGQETKERLAPVRTDKWLSLKHFR